MTQRREKMASIDAAWYHMDGSTNLTMVTGVILTSTPLDFARVKAVYAHRLLRFRRFRQRVVEHPLSMPTPYWEDDPYFNIDDHIHHVALPEPRNKRALLDLMSDLASTPLDYRRPLWQVHVVDRVDGGSALVLRFHHCIGDGVALMAIGQELLDTRSDAPLDRTPPAAPARRTGVLERFTQPLVNLAAAPMQLVSSTLHTSADLVAHPEKLTAAAGLGAGVVNSAVTLLVKKPDPKTPIKGPLGVPKRVAWSEPVDLADVKAIGKLADAKVNDVLIAAMAGALRHYLLERKTKIDLINIRAIVPVDLRGASRSALELGNEFGLVFLDLPIGVSGPMERLRATKRGMDALKRSAEATAMYTIMDILGYGPKPVADLAVKLFTSKGTAVMTNVAGPRQAYYLAGTPIERMMFWVPHPGSVGMGISIMSYNGAATLGLVVDAGLVPDPERITAEFGREFARLLAVAKAEKEPLAAAHCAGFTASGQPCQNVPFPGSAYCSLHQPQTAAADQPRCAGIMASGERCRNRPTPGSAYCPVHKPRPAAPAAAPAAVGSPAVTDGRAASA